MGADILETRTIRRVTLAMMALAALALELVLAEPDRSPSNCILTTLGMLVAPSFALAWALGRRAPRGRTRGRGGLSPLAVVALLALFAAPFVLETGQFLLFGRGAMLEVVLLSAVRNLGLGLASLSHRPACARLTATISLFLVLVAETLGEGWLIRGLAGLYAVAGTSWLMLTYWSRVNGVAARGDRRLPASAMAWVAGVMVALAAGLTFGPADAALVLAGVMPTSGGTLWNDPDARGGVNDGDNEVGASKDPRSVGFSRSEIYLDTDRPSLYDAFNETYGEPYKPKEMRRMIALGVSDVREQRERPAENLKAGREFALVRRQPDRSPGRPGEREADALVYVDGPTPLHLTLAAYDRFDGRTWREEPYAGTACQMERQRGGTWMCPWRSTSSIFAGTVAHRIKIGTLDSSPLPLPAHVERFRVGSVDRTDFFGWAQAGILRMVDRTVPAGTVLESESRTVEPRRLATAVTRSETIPARYLGSGGYSVDPRVAELARGWVAGVPEGWAQVEAIVAALRRHCTHDRGFTAPADHRDLAAHFLLDSRRGPDYLFATAAVVLLRSRGYPSRVVSGLYAAPERYDARTRHTPVTREDVHFWAEVALPGGPSVAIEPTPGYRLPGPSLPWTDRIAGVLAAVWDWGKTHAPALVLASLGLIAGYRSRRVLHDALATLAWWIAPGRAARGCVLKTLRLVELRSRWAGCSRPPGLTLARWYGPIAAAAGESRGDLDRLVRLADRVLYAPRGDEDRQPWDVQDIHSLCRRVVRAWTLGRFRALARSETRKGPAPCSPS